MRVRVKQGGPIQAITKQLDSVEVNCKMNGRAAKKKAKETLASGPN
jgi:uncharacterized protein YodC (DUF2158 family)